LNRGLINSGCRVIRFSNSLFAFHLSKTPLLNNVPNSHIIAFTSYAMTGNREKAFNAGCTGYIEKPIDPETIISEIQKVVGVDKADA